MSSPAPRLAAVGTALPPHFADQEAIISAFRAVWSRQHFNLDRLEELHRAVRVKGRHLALPLEAYPAMERFAERNDAWAKVGLEVGAEALTRAASEAGIALRDIDHLFFVTVTGIATPSLDARLINRLGLRTDLKRTPIFGLGCLAGAAGVARAADYLRAFPEHTAALLSVELCSLTLQREDLSITNIIASGLFGDGAAAVVLRGADAPHGTSDSTVGMPRVLATQSVFYPDTERIMGWDVVDSGFKVVLSARVPQLVRTHLRGNVEGFLAAHGLERSKVRHWIAHTGGPKVLDAVGEALELPSRALDLSWASLNELGNLSSASVLFVLGDCLRSRRAEKGDYGLLLAMGPGFCAELVLLQW